MADTPERFLTGACHCGGVRLMLTLTRAPADLQVRACQCAFCTRQGAKTISDPAGKAVLEIAAGRLGTYQFGTRTATSLVCRECGVYAGAVIADGDRLWSIANVRGLAIAGFEGRDGEPQHYEHETPEERIARRKRRWTPTEIRCTF